MNGVTPSTPTRGMVICSGIYLAVAALYTALYDAVAWVWFGWSVMAIITAVLVATER
ncbi:hypothetical protein [Yinghuangia seranimata]|uniref:hypothetical protein n=1 Tax=Yinghuangia seranimata TaxID=408067 RepID=UPI00248C032B|nr:hypothetical protein [Yinghuangia seranimata]MDI2124928.1 hypothetical protein [Yinghuangia seranimata]